MKIYSLMVLCISLVISLPSFAHAGHDHTSVFSSFVHLFWLAPALMVVAILYIKLLKTNYKIKSAKPQLKDN